MTHLDHDPTGKYRSAFLLVLEYEPPRGAFRRDSAFAFGMRAWTSTWWLFLDAGNTLEQRESSGSMSSLRVHYFEIWECACVMRAGSAKIDLPLKAAFAVWNRKRCCLKMELGSLRD